MASNRQLSDKGLVRGTFVVSIDSVDYILKTYDHAKPIRSEKEYGEAGYFESSSHIADQETLQVEIMARVGVQDPSQLVPFSFDGKLWTVGSLNKRGTTEGLTSFSAEIQQLASTTESTITVTA
jgi:hypothetical protein